VIRWLAHWLEGFFGTENGSGTGYLFWSGIFADVALFTGGVVALRKLNCGVKWCPRIGRHEYQMGEVRHVLCRRHHPHTDGAVTLDQVNEHHRRSKETG
jgi:hypothetical protein